ncbi:MAG: 3-methyladenine DNA glycosylase [Campylobacterales bacterium]
MRSSDLFIALHQQDLLGHRAPWWWPQAGTFEVVVGAVLTQQSRWEKVEESLSNLRKLALLDLHAIAAASQWQVAQAVTPSGFYNQKAQRLIALSRAIVAEYGDFAHFQEQVTREWLLQQKGIGPESADSILCYGCFREEMVVDSYTARLLAAFGFEDLDYDTLKAWLAEGVASDYERLCGVIGYEAELAELYARFHGMIVEFCKQGCKQADTIRQRLLLE